MLHVSNLTRRYGQFVAVDRASFGIEKGEILGLLGHNGAGKTTIMKMLSGYLEPDAGEIRFEGEDLARHPKRIQQALGYLPENLPVYPEMTVADYLDYAGRMKGLTGAALTGEIRRALDATETGDKLLSPIGTLSRGYKQRVGVAQALLGRPKLLILDEPTNGLDPTQTDQMRSLIRELSRDATVILSTHIMQEVEALCERVLILRAGQLALDERLDALRNTRELTLVTSMVPKAAQDFFNSSGTVSQWASEALEGKADRYRYRLKLADTTEPDTASAELAQRLMETGEKLYALSPRRQDLETLFREVSRAPRNAAESQKEEDHHAA